VVLLDGAGIPGVEAVCHHGTAWYAQSLGVALLTRLSGEAGSELAAALAESIRHVAGLHAHTCDIVSSISPQASVAVVRFAGGRADFLVLADVFVVLDLAGARPQVVTDEREACVRRECLSVLAGLRPGTPERAQALGLVQDAFRARRNRSGGFWVAKDDPYAALQAVTGSVALERIHGAALLSNGASRAAGAYQLLEWPAMLHVLRTTGPAEILRLVREAEARAEVPEPSTGMYAPDDATVALCEPTAGSRAGSSG